MRNFVTANLNEVETRLIAERTRLFGTAKIPVLLMLKKLKCVHGKTIRIIDLYKKIAAARGSMSRVTVYQVIDRLVDERMVLKSPDTGDRMQVQLAVRGNLLANALLIGWTEEGRHPTDLDLVSNRDAWPSAAARVIQTIYADLPLLNL